MLGCMKACPLNNTRYIISASIGMYTCRRDNAKYGLTDEARQISTSSNEMRINISSWGGRGKINTIQWRAFLILQIILMLFPAHKNQKRCQKAYKCVLIVKSILGAASHWQAYKFIGSSNQHRIRGEYGSTPLPKSLRRYQTEGRKFLSLRPCREIFTPTLPIVCKCDSAWHEKRHRFY